VAAEASFVLQMVGERSEMSWIDRGYIGGQALRLEEVPEVGYAADDDINGCIGLALGAGVEPVSGDEVCYLRPGGG